MMRRRWAKLAVALPFLLTGCKGFWDAPPASTTTTSTASGGDFYVLNVTTEQVAGFSIVSGVPTALPGSPVSLGVAPLSMAIAPGAGFLYVGTESGIYVFSIASTGQLTAGNNSQPISGDKAASMVVSPNGGWLIDVQASAPTVNAIALNASTGLPTSTGEQVATLPAVTGVNPQVVISPDSSYVFAAMGTEGTAVIPFTAANADPFGGVGRIATAGSGGEALSVAVDPIQSGQTTPRLLYIGETLATSGATDSENTGGLRVFNFASLATGLQELSGSPLAISGLAPYSILPISTGNYVYVVSRTVNGSNTGVIAGFAVAGSSGVYSVTALGSSFAVGTNPVGLAEDSTGTYVLAVDSNGDPDLMGYTFSSTNAGYLVSAISAATGTDPVGAGAIVAVP